MMSAQQRLGMVIYNVSIQNFKLLHHVYRRNLRRGESVKYLISDEVITYIKKNNLYQVRSSNVTYSQDRL